MTIKPIRNDGDLKRVFRRLEKIFQAEEGTAQADERDVLVTLVEAYEIKHYDFGPPDPVEAIKFRMERDGLTPRDLEPFIGPSGRVSEVLNRERPLSLRMVKRLHDGLKITYESNLGPKRNLLTVNLTVSPLTIAKIDPRGPPAPFITKFGSAMPPTVKSTVAGLFCSITIAAASASGESVADREVDAAFPPARALYEEIHRHPELSEHEVDTAARIARALGKAGYQVTEHVGGNGVVGVLKNGSGPTVMLRTELDALPVEEKTGLPYASTVKVRGDGGAEVPVMHACGHDLHMASLVAVARIMAGTLDSWHGTLVLIGQPGEEGFDGAGKMLADGLFTRFPKPDAVLALHVSNSQPAGSVGVVAGTYNSYGDSLRVTLYGRGGHGSAPHTAIDPVVMAAKVVLALQTITSREIKPGEFAVVTVGYLHAGTKNNIIPDSAELGLTVRSYKPEIRKQLLAAIERTVKGEALAAGAPREPSIEHLGATDSVYNDPALTRRMAEALRSVLGPKSVETIDPITASEDFSRYVAAGVPGFYLALGGAAQAAYSRAVSDGRPLPSNHSSLFAPDVDPALRTAIRAEVAMLRNLLQGEPLNLKSAGAGQ